MGGTGTVIQVEAIAGRNQNPDALFEALRETILDRCYRLAGYRTSRQDLEVLGEVWDYRERGSSGMLFAWKDWHPDSSVDQCIHWVDTLVDAVPVAFARICQQHGYRLSPRTRSPADALVGSYCSCDICAALRARRYPKRLRVGQDPGARGRAEDLLRTDEQIQELSRLVRSELAQMKGPEWFAKDPPPSFLVALDWFEQRGARPSVLETASLLMAHWQREDALAARHSVERPTSS